MGFLSNLRKNINSTKREKAAQMNGKQLKDLLKKFKEERDRSEKLSSFLDDYGNVYESPYCNTTNIPIQYEAETQRWKIESMGGTFPVQ